MSSEEDKPPAPPVRLTSTNRGNLIFHTNKRACALNDDDGIAECVQWNSSNANVQIGNMCNLFAFQSISMLRIFWN